MLLATLTASSVARRTGLFLYFVPWLALIPLTSGAAILFDRFGWPLREPEVARLLAGASAAWLTIAWLVDRGDGRYARPLYLAGYLLLPFAMLLSLLDRTASLQVVGFGILVYVVSAVADARRPAALLGAAGRADLRLRPRRARRRRCARSGCTWPSGCSRPGR